MPKIRPRAAIVTAHVTRVRENRARAKALEGGHARACPAAASFSTMNPKSRTATKIMRWSVPPMLRALLLGVVTLAVAGPALAAGDVDTCRNTTAEPAARLAACESVLADDKIT